MLSKSGCFKIVERSENARVHTSKWELKKKRGEEGKVLKYKARLVFRGDTEWYRQFLRKCPSILESSLQTSIATSSREAEYITLADASKIIV